MADPGLRLQWKNKIQSHGQSENGWQFVSTILILLNYILSASGNLNFYTNTSFVKAVFHYAIFRATSVATAKSAFLQLHEQRCYTLQCFLQLVSQLVPQRARLRLKAYFYWLIAQNVARQVARGVLHYAMLQIHCSVAAIVAKSRTWLYFVQSLLQQKCCETWWLRDMLHRAISRATCVATKLRDKLHEKSYSVTPP